ncbi:hypothetical protein NW064_01155 [Mycoplasmopsis felis]|uniref:hypothetical protein n=1 Tax=Mycoplasmopsis felis TaxID=33923 RepID=UPI0021AEFD47|nr:hypothetical protein [Mycoplasmopsis felis]UWW01041.1 hypothetical protein NW064_01155 [Mycoplasmopsis felis]
MSKDNLRSKINEVNSFIDSLNDAKYNNIKDKIIQDKIQAQRVLNKTDATQNQVDQD